MNARTATHHKSSASAVGAFLSTHGLRHQICTRTKPHLRQHALLVAASRTVRRSSRRRSSCAAGAGYRHAHIHPVVGPSLIHWVPPSRLTPQTHAHTCARNTGTCARTHRQAHTHARTRTKSIKSIIAFQAFRFAASIKARLAIECHDGSHTRTHTRARTHTQLVIAVYHLPFD